MTDLEQSLPFWYTKLSKNTPDPLWRVRTAQTICVFDLVFPELFSYKVGLTKLGLVASTRKTLTA